MRIIKAFFKKYWATILVFTGLGLWYYYATEYGEALSYLFPKVSSIANAFDRTECSPCGQRYGTGNR